MKKKDRKGVSQDSHSDTIQINLTNNTNAGYITLNNLTDGYQGDPVSDGQPPVVTYYISDDGKSHQLVMAVSNYQNFFDPYSDVVGTVTINFPDGSISAIHWHSGQDPPVYISTTIINPSDTYELTTPSEDSNGIWQSTAQAISSDT